MIPNERIVTACREAIDILDNLCVVWSEEEPGIERVKEILRELMSHQEDSPMIRYTDPTEADLQAGWMSVGLSLQPGDGPIFDTMMNAIYTWPSGELGPTRHAGRERPVCRWDWQDGILRVQFLLVKDLRR